MFIDESLNSIAQLAVSLAIALGFWAVFGRKVAGFFNWIGLTVPPAKAMGLAFVLFLLWAAAYCLLFWVLPEFAAAASADNTIPGELRANGLNAETLAVIAVVAGIKTALAEEIFFRGLIAKRLIHAMGFWWGNTLQALIFGGVHLLIFTVPGGPEFALLPAVLFLLIPGAGGWAMGYVNERAGNGSILPGWLMHALGNAVSYPVLAFLL